MEAEAFVPSWPLTVFVAVIVVVVTYFLISRLNSVDKSDPTAESEVTANGVGAEPDHTGGTSRKKSKSTTKTPSVSQQPSFHHSWLVTTLKGHSGRATDLDFSPNGKFLVSCADDRTLLLWNVKEFGEKDRKSLRGNVDLDSCRTIQFGPDSKSLVGCLATANRISVFKLSKREDGGGVKIQQADGVNFPQNTETDIMCVGIACNGKFVMSSDSKAICIYDLKGNLLKRLETKQNGNFHAAISPCGRFVGSSGFTPDVKLWEVTFSKTGDFQDVVRAFELKGHTSGVYSFAFNNDTTRMASVSKDGTFRVWNTFVEYKFGQTPFVIASGSLDALKLAPALIAMSPTGDSLCVTVNRSLHIYNAVESLREETAIEEVSSDAVAKVEFSTCGKYFAAVCDKHIRVFHNVAGYHATIAQTKEQIAKAQGQAHKERLKQQLAEAQETLARILGEEAA